MKKLFTFTLFSLLGAIMIGQPVFAVFDPYYNTNNNIIMLDDPNATTGCGAGASVSGFPASTAKVDSATLQRIKALQKKYETVSADKHIPWQMFAAIDYREDNNSPDKSMLGGEPLGTPAVDSGKTPTTKEESIAMGADILSSLAKNVYGVDVTKSGLSFEQLQQAFIVYNRGFSYKNANQSPDTSPYVMNQYDDKHKNMTFPTIAGETLAGRTETGRYGAMTIYVNLVGSSGDTGSCFGGGVGAKVDYSNLYPKLDAGTLSADMLCTPRPSQTSFKLLKGPACDSFLALDAAYKLQFNKPIPVGEGYRTADVQITCGGTKENPGGTNPACIYYDPKTTPPEHLWGTAIDFREPLNDAGSTEHKWLVANGPKYGWFWPNWASSGHGGNAGVGEPWHFGYYFVGHDPKNDNLESLK